MKKTMLLLLAAFTIHYTYSQNSFKAIIKDAVTKEGLVGATALIKNTTKAAVSDFSGQLELKDLPVGKQAIVFRYVGYKEQEREFVIPSNSLQPIEIFLEAGEELEEIMVQSTRSSRTIQDVPTRIEAIELEEIEEKSNMRPSNVSMLLHESTGIQVQQTSATSANASIRIQGLDGKYTQLLKDGFSNFGGFSSGLSVMEIPPLDLKQVEVIKGPVSTLYGGGAIAGVVNFISKTPMEQKETLFLLNQSHIGQTNAGAFASRKYKKVGFTVLGLINSQELYDVDNDDFTELPGSKDVTIHPKLFFYPNEKTTIVIGNSLTKAVRIGGDKFAIENREDTLHTYFEENETLRNIFTFELTRKVKEKNSLGIKTSFAYYDRSIEIPGYFFRGRQYNSYNELSYAHQLKKHSLIGGLNFIYDSFNELEKANGLKRDQANFVEGIFVQDSWDVTGKFFLETGLRIDHVGYTLENGKQRETFVLPRISALFKWTRTLTSRIGGGMGYKTPTLFTEQTEAMQYRNVKPLMDVNSEKSYGGTADIGFKTSIATDWIFSVNQLFFLTQVQQPLILQEDSTTYFYFKNSDQSILTKGFETNVKLAWKEVKLYAGYTYTSAIATYLEGNQTMPLVPKHKVNLALIYESKKVKIGLEGYFSDQQFLNNGSYSPSFWEFGAMAEKMFKKFSIYVNAENFTDTRQSRYESVVIPPHNNPVFKDIWTHTEGFVLSGGIKIKF